MSKIKTLCDWDKKEIEKNSSELKSIISNPKYYCKKCARASSNKDYVCKPKKLDSAK